MQIRNALNAPLPMYSYLLFHLQASAGPQPVAGNISPRAARGFALYVVRDGTEYPVHFVASKWSGQQAEKSRSSRSLEVTSRLQPVILERGAVAGLLNKVSSLNLVGM